MTNRRPLDYPRQAPSVRLGLLMRGREPRFESCNRRIAPREHRECGAQMFLQFFHGALAGPQQLIQFDFSLREGMSTQFQLTLEPR
jgi:hypothetical protein